MKRTVGALIECPNAVSRRNERRIAAECCATLFPRRAFSASLLPTRRLAIAVGHLPRLRLDFPNTFRSHGLEYRRLSIRALEVRYDRATRRNACYKVIVPHSCCCCRCTRIAVGAFRRTVIVAGLYLRLIKADLSAKRAQIGRRA